MWLKFLRDHIGITTIVVLIFIGFINWFGPKHSGTSRGRARFAHRRHCHRSNRGSATPYLTTQFLEPRHESLTKVWVQFVGVILALSGVEAIANLTGVMKLDTGSTPDRPSVPSRIVQSDYCPLRSKWFLKHRVARLGDALPAEGDGKDNGPVEPQ